MRQWLSFVRDSRCRIILQGAMDGADLVPSGWGPIYASHISRSLPESLWFSGMPEVRVLFVLKPQCTAFLQTMSGIETKARPVGGELGNSPANSDV